jgi:YggT family protein
VNILCRFLDIYLLVLLARAVLSFLPVGPDSALFGVNRALIMITEPVLAPMRRVIPPLGMFDMSFLVLVIVIEVVQTSVLHCTGSILGF